ncbi:unnamed protein product, partial [Adineta steineri]
SPSSSMPTVEYDDDSDEHQEESKWEWEWEWDENDHDHNGEEEEGIMIVYDNTSDGYNQHTDTDGDITEEWVNIDGTEEWVDVVVD